MEDDCREENTAPACVGNPSHLKINGGVDLISSLPDEILHHILSFVPTNLAITTTVLSKRWRRVWCETPSLSFVLLKTSSESISKTLANYSAAKIMSFHLCFESETYLASNRVHEFHDIDSLIKFAMSRNVEKLSLEFRLSTYFPLPDFFFSNSSLKQLIVKSRFRYLTTTCTVSWTSLRNLSLSFSQLSDESIHKILSGSPMLESLSLRYCYSLCCLDLSESLRLRRLDIDFYHPAPRQLMIVAPHIHYLRLINFREKCTLADVSSLVEANIDTAYYLPRFWCIEVDPLKAVVFQVMVETMLEKIQNVENLTVGLSFLQMLAMADFCGVPFPTLKVKTLTLETRVLRSIVPGITKLLQNSPGLKKITVYTTKDWNTAVDKYVNSYIDPQELDPDQCWRFKDVVFPPSSEFKFAKPNLIGSFMELLLGNTRTLETLLLQLGGYLNRSSFDELYHIALTLSHKYKVSIMLK